MKYVAYAYEKLAERSGAPAAFIPMETQRPLRQLKSALNGFLHIGILQKIRGAGKQGHIQANLPEKGRTFTHTVYCDFYCSKIYPINTKRFNMYHNRKDVIPLKASDVQRDMQYLGVAELYFKQLSEIPKYDPQIINVTTWNDYRKNSYGSK
ncbi:MAG: hypothetical protein ACLUKN_08355 [Bacilli bacterium]